MCFRAMPNHAGFRVDAKETGPDPNGRDKGTVGPVGYWPMDDTEGIREPLVGAGAEVKSPITRVRDDSWIATLTDPYGDAIGLLGDTA